ncbi:MAG: hypothetical protein O7A69_11790 [SAR324 cluster bacterium]|nr:hypothetical protein [SAR324 cluster bacterium]
MAGSFDAGSGNPRGLARTLRLISLAVLLLALTRVSSAAGANENTAPRLGGRDSGIAYFQQLAPLPFPFTPPGLDFLQSGGEFLDSAPPGPDNSSGRPQQSPRGSAGLFMLHEPKHNPAGDNPVDAEAEIGTKAWFGIELVFMILDAEGELLVELLSGGEASEDSMESEEKEGQREIDGGMFGLNFSFGFGGQAAGVGFIGEVGYLNGDFAEVDEKIFEIEGVYYLAGPSLRFDADSKSSGSLDVLVGKVDDPRISTLVNLRFNIRSGGGPVSSGFYYGITVSLLYIGFEEDFSSEIGDLNLLWGFLVGGQI